MTDRRPGHPPLVSVGVPVHNGEAYLEQTLTALLDQTFGDFELIVCDNASTDRTPQIVAEFAAADPRVRSVRNPTNIGLARNFNRVFQLSQGRYFRWAMADDLVDPTNLQDCVDALEADPGAVLAVPSWDLIDGAGGPARGGGEPASFTWDTTPGRRMQQFIDMINGPSSIAVLAYLSGLVRSEALWATDQLGSYPSWDLIDGAGGPARGGEPTSFTWDTTPGRRMQQFIDMINGPSSIAVLAYLSGLVRSEALWATDQLGSYPSSDQVLLGQLLLRGRFVEVPGRSLHVRLHEASAGHGIGRGDYAAVHRTFFPDTPPRKLLRWRATRYRKMWDVLQRASTSRAELRALRVRYARSSALELLP